MSSWVNEMKNSEQKASAAFAAMKKKHKAKAIAGLKTKLGENIKSTKMTRLVFAQ